MAIKDNIGYDGEWEEYNAMAGLAEQGYSIKEFAGKKNKDLQKMVDELEPKKSRCKNILQQTNEQIEYEDLKELLLMKRSQNIKESDFNKYFKEKHPRPAYTINQQPVNGKMIV